MCKWLVLGPLFTRLFFFFFFSRLLFTPLRFFLQTVPLVPFHCRTRRLLAHVAYTLHLTLVSTTMISALQWVRRGAAQPKPDKYDLDEKEFNRINEFASQHLADAKEDLEAARKAEGK